jgi:hypothetical protein
MGSEGDDPSVQRMVEAGFDRVRACTADLDVGECGSGVRVTNSQHKRIAQILSDLGMSKGV